MNTITKRLTHLTMVAAMLAAGFTAHALQSASPEVRVVQLPTVVVTGKRIPVVQLERVVITARRMAPATTFAAQRGAAERV